MTDSEIKQMNMTDSHACIKQQVNNIFSYKIL